MIYFCLDLINILSDEHDFDISLYSLFHVIASGSMTDVKMLLDFIGSDLRARLSLRCDGPIGFGLICEV